MIGGEEMASSSNRERFILNIKKKFFTESVIRHWCESPFLDVFKRCVDVDMVLL